MNKIIGKINKIYLNELVSELEIESSSIIIKILLLQVPANFHEGDEAEFFFKESEVIIAKKNASIDKSVISVENIIDGKITEIKNGKIFVEVSVETQIGIINVLTERETFERLEVSNSSIVSLLLKANSIGIGVVE